MMETITNEQIKSFEESLEKLIKDKQNNSFMKILKVDRKEEMHTNFLSFLFNDKVIGGNFAIKNLKIILDKNSYTRDLDIASFEVIREYCFNSSKSRADLFFKVTTKDGSIFNIIIENKIDHFISKIQIDNYIEWKSKGKNNFLFLLLPESYEINANTVDTSGIEEDKIDGLIGEMKQKIEYNFTTITYSDIFSLCNKLSGQCDNNINFLLENYVSCLEDSGLIASKNDFFKEHKCVLSAVISAISDNNIDGFNQTILNLYRSNVNFIITLLDQDNLKKIQSNLQTFRIGNSGRLVNRSTLLRQIAEKYRDDKVGKIKNVIDAYFENVEHNFFYKAEEFKGKSLKHENWFTKQKNDNFHYLNAWYPHEIVDFIDYLNENLEGVLKIERYK